MYDPKTVSEMLDLPPSTLRRYASDYAEFLSETARQGGKKRRYADNDIAILKRIRDLIRQRKSPEEIKQLILVIEPEEETGSALALLPAVIQEFENLRAQLAEVQADQASTREELREARDRLARLEEYLRLPWWKRLGRRPPEV